MRAGSSVRPEKWNDILDLFDDGEYSAIWGNYNGAKTRCLGVRWNGEEGNVGYPNQGINPLWYIEPKFLTIPILSGLLLVVEADDTIKNRDEYNNNILKAINEASVNYQQNSD